MNIIITGPQGSGKGTQASLLSKKFNLFHMESGKMLRELGEKDPRIKEMVDNGILVSDEETIKYMEEWIKKNGADFGNVIFDGFPRSLGQYNSLKAWLKSLGQKIDKAIYINLSEETAIKRIGSRRTCVKCGQVYNLVTNPPKLPNKCDCGGKLEARKDDRPDAIRKRLETFNEKTKPLLEEYKKEGILVEVDGECPIDVIFEDILNKLGLKNG